MYTLTKKYDGVVLEGLQDIKLNKIEKPNSPIINGFRMIKDIDVPEIPNDFTLFTWGEIDGAPKLIGEISKTTYSMPNTDTREDISIDIHRESRKRMYEEKRKCTNSL